MTDEEVLEELETLAVENGIRIRYEKGDFDGGFCILRDEKIIVINKKVHPTKKASYIAQAFTQIGIDAIFIKPFVRNYIEDEVAKAR